MQSGGRRSRFRSGRLGSHVCELLLQCIHSHLERHNDIPRNSAAVSTRSLIPSQAASPPLGPARNVLGVGFPAIALQVVDTDDSRYGAASTGRKDPAERNEPRGVSNPASPPGVPAGSTPHTAHQRDSESQHCSFRRPSSLTNSWSAVARVHLHLNRVSSTSQVCPKLLPTPRS